MVDSKQSKPAPSKKITITVLNNTYDLTYPNVGQSMDIDILKSQLSGGRYESLKLSILPSFVETSKKIDVVAYFNILIPKLRDDITAGGGGSASLLNLMPEEFAPIQEAYENQFLPWFEQWEDIFASIREEKAKEA